MIVEYKIFEYFYDKLYDAVFDRVFDREFPKNFNGRGDRSPELWKVIPKSAKIDFTGRVTSDPLYFHLRLQHFKKHGGGYIDEKSFYKGLAYLKEKQPITYNWKNDLDALYEEFRIEALREIEKAENELRLKVPGAKINPVTLSYRAKALDNSVFIGEYFAGERRDRTYFVFKTSINDENRTVVTGKAVVHVQEKDGSYLHKYETQRIDGFFVYDSLLLLTFENMNEKLNAGVEILRLSVDGKTLKGSWVVDAESYPDYWNEHTGTSTYYRLESDFESNLQTAKEFLENIDVPDQQFIHR